MDTATMTNLINDYGYLAIALLIALENIFPPIPSEVILTFTGFLTISTDLNLFGAIIAATVGAVVGAAVLYALGHFLAVEKIEAILNGKLGKILHLKPEDVDKAANFFNRHGGTAVFFGRFVPVVRSLISIPAGMTHFSFTRFLVFSTFGTLIWNTVLIYVGHYAGNAWPQIVATIDEYSHLVLLAVVILCVVGFIWHKRKKA
ncbi:DedA family protein [Ligilactobacillus sp. Marseille-Q7487]|uniref:DedA family protein n=1 Tax=Ligilactobacillus sp. Marseille-Q7487 TaxID=3022128 RepID=UPI0024A8D868|nr:DedA family protein [Ligilactobacillus sp. Marseille-Q7487]